MSEKKSDWEPDAEAAIKSIIERTINEAGTDDPALLPSRVRRALSATRAGGALGETELEQFIRDVRAKRR
ncbi:MAG: hypothetical protein AAGC56_01960 [Pseudomonadota bacterium]